MHRHSSRLLALCVALVPGALPIASQDMDHFGSAVLFAGDELVVIKPTPARGPAAAFVYRNGVNGWTRVSELRGPAAVSRGEALTAGLAYASGELFVGAGDPSWEWGAHTWSRDTDGWTARDGVRIGQPPVEGGGVTVAFVFQILGPAPRVIAAHGDGVVVGFRGSAEVFTRSGDGWAAAATLTRDGGSRVGFATSIAMGESVVAVGDPVRGSGTVRLFAPDAEGVWQATAVLPTDSLAARSRFGTAVALEGNTLVVGAPRADTAGVVFVYQRDAAGSWTAVERIRVDNVEGFGTSVALLGDEMLVAARNGPVHRFVRRGGVWTHAQQLVTAIASSALQVALGPDVAALGAPDAQGGRGRVVVFERGSDGAFEASAVLAPPVGPSTMTGAEVRCADSVAASFACHDVDLQAFLSLETLGASPGERISDLWGWTDPETGREYALVGVQHALVFVDITQPATPVIVGEMPANPSGARDIKVFRDHAFMTGDGAGQHGLMVFDLSRLRGARAMPALFEPDTVYHGIASAHNLAIDTASGLAVPMAATGGGETCGGGLHLVNISEPLRPTFAGCYTDSEGLLMPGRTHDAQCVVYQGPDLEHRGKSICFASNETALRIVDVTDRANPVPLSAGHYPGSAYIHQGWLTEDHRYFYLDDEIDELVGTTDRTRTMIWDLADLDDPVIVGTYLGPDAATDHNLYVRGNRMYQANYQAGLRVIDISDPLSPVEVGFFDTTPYPGNPAGIYGAWTAYPFFGSGTVIVSSMQEGLFVLRPRTPVLVP